MATLEDDVPVWIGSANDFYTYWFMDLGGKYEAQINALLVRSWPRIQAALNTSGQSSCALAPGMLTFLREQHLIMAMVMLNIPGVRLETDQRTLYSEMLTDTLTKLADGLIKVCDGDTASNVPASGRISRYG